MELAGQVALVTGASRGIGAAAAVELARRGAHVVITARSQGGLAETDDAIRAAGGHATLLPLGRLDVLVGNAGALGVLTPVPHILPRDWAEVVGVNLSAAWKLIGGCAPLLLAAPAGRAVFVTSRIVRQPAAYWGAYGATKAGLEHLVLAWAAETRTSRLRVNLFDPGVVATRLRAAAMPGEDPATLPKPADVAPALADLCGSAETRHGAVITAQP